MKIQKNIFFWGGGGGSGRGCSGGGGHRLDVNKKKWGGRGWVRGCE